MKDSKASPTEDIVSDIKKRLHGNAAIVGVGNIMRGDDGLGPKSIELLKEKKVNAKLFDCGTAPENYIFPILSSACDTIIFIDAADFHSRPGTIKIFDMTDISDISFSTHTPSPRLFTDLLKTGKDDLSMFIVSVQPEQTTLGAPLSAEVKAALPRLADILVKALK